MNHRDAEALAAEIARLEAELSETQTPHELAASLERPSLQHVMSQRDYVEVTEKFVDSDDDCSNLYSTAEASCDEVTVMMEELADIAEEGLTKPSPVRVEKSAKVNVNTITDELSGSIRERSPQRPTLDHFPQRPSTRSITETHPASPKHASPLQQKKASVAGFLAEIRPVPLTMNEQVSPTKSNDSIDSSVSYKHSTYLDAAPNTSDYPQNDETASVSPDPKYGTKKVLQHETNDPAYENYANKDLHLSTSPKPKVLSSNVEVALPIRSPAATKKRSSVQSSPLQMVQLDDGVPSTPKKSPRTPKRLDPSAHAHVPKKKPSPSPLSPLASKKLHAQQAENASVEGEAAKLEAEIKRIEAEIIASPVKSTAARKLPTKSPKTPKRRNASTPLPKKNFQSPGPCMPTKTNTGPAHAKYQQMLKIGLPEAAIRHAMEKDGVDSSVLFADESLRASPRISKSQTTSKKNKTDVENEEARLKAEIERIEAELVVDQQSVQSKHDPANAKYHQMQKIGLPENAIRHAMEKDGVDPSVIFGSDSQLQLASTKEKKLGHQKAEKEQGETKTVADKQPARPPCEPAHAKYHQMLKIGLPEAAIRHAMEKDGVDPLVLFGSDDIRASQQIQKSQTTPTKDKEFARLKAQKEHIAIKTVPDKQSARPRCDPAHAKYHQMLKIGLPEAAIRHAMEKDGVDPLVLSGTIQASVTMPKVPASPKKACASKPYASKDDPKYSKYFTMLEIGLPEGAVVNAMERDGLDPSAVIANHKPSPMRQKKPQRSPIDDEAARLELEIKRMEEELASTQKTEESSPAPPSMGSLLGAIENAANSREKRIQENDGEMYMQEVTPEVEARHVTPQLTTSMAEMVMQRAVAREKRLEAGGEKRMRKVVIKERDEYKNDFSNIVTDAAAMGRLTRLNEHTVEAVAQEKNPEEEWRSNGLLAIQWRSNHMSVIHDAARAGNEVKLPEHIVSNYEEEDQDGCDPESGEKRISPRMRQLLELNKQVGEGQQKVDKLVLGRKEEAPKGDSLLIKPMVAYNNIDDVKLPRRAPPKIDPKKNAEKLSKMTKEALKAGRPMTDISVGVAEIAWERRARLDRPGSLPKMKEQCDCPYCVNGASPFQTFAYRELERKRKEQHLQRQKEKLAAHEQTHNDDENSEMLPDVTENGEEYGDLDEVTRKRLERKRVREERRKLKEAVAQAEAAVVAAKVEAEAAQQHSMNVAASYETTAVQDTEQQQVEPNPPPSGLQLVPQQEQQFQPTVSDPESAVQTRVNQWNSSPTSKAAEQSKYAQHNPAESAGCRCVIM